MRRCMCCFEPAAYIPHNSQMALCEECHMSMEDDFEASMEDEVGLPFDEYYDFEWVGED